MHWLQWPVRVCQSKVDEDEGEVETHTVGTKSLELNADAVREMVEWYHGDFVDITQLTLEAPFSWNSIMALHGYQCNRLKSPTTTTTTTTIYT